jgi:hypothetical protein
MENEGVWSSSSPATARFASIGLLPPLCIQGRREFGARPRQFFSRRSAPRLAIVRFPGLFRSQTRFIPAPQPHSHSRLARNARLQRHVSAVAPQRTPKSSTSKRMKWHHPPHAGSVSAQRAATRGGARGAVSANHAASRVHTRTVGDSPFRLAQILLGCVPASCARPCKAKPRLSREASASPLRTIYPAAFISCLTLRL